MNPWCFDTSEGPFIDQFCGELRHTESNDCFAKSTPGSWHPKISRTSTETYIQIETQVCIITYIYIICNMYIYIFIIKNCIDKKPLHQKIIGIPILIAQKRSKMNQEIKFGQPGFSTWLRCSGVECLRLVVKLDLKFWSGDLETWWVPRCFVVLWIIRVL